MESWSQPELIFGLVGPIGVDMAMVESRLEHALVSVGYIPKPIRLTSLMEQVAVDEKLEEGADPLSHYNSRIRYANAVRAKCSDGAALVALGILAIREIREQENLKQRGEPKENENYAEIPLKGHAYVIRQLKRPEEVHLLRKVYGRKFIQISVSLDTNERINRITKSISSKNPNLDPKGARDAAKALVERDYNEQAVPHGQRIEDVFYLGDVFVSAKSDSLASETLRRFIEAFFGRNSISPNRDEYGLYIATSASLRSIDTARQVGAAIFSSYGEVISLGCNEVPASGGGTYWTDHEEPHRDFDDGHDANNTHKRRIAFDFVKRLKEAGFINFDGSDNDLFAKVMRTEQADKSLLMDITEFGRMAHAEMSAMLDAARLGRPIKNAILYCTTFPCHNCAKHIVASGIKRVVYIEPYPKSQAVELHGDSISIEEKDQNKVLFQHFIGISPRRYRDIFEKGRRRDRQGNLQEWYEGEPLPRVEDKSPYYVFNESSAVYSSLEKVAAELGIHIEEG